MKPAFTPVFNLNKAILKTDEKGKDLTWYSENALYKYPYMLVSAFYGKKHEDMRKDFNIPKDVFIIGDSGGAQLITDATKKINPLEILEWQEKNVNVAIGLDFPPIVLAEEGSMLSGKSLTKEEYLRRLNITVQNNQLYEQNRENFDIKIYNVLHGRSTDEMKLWYDKVKDFKFNGWAVSIKTAPTELPIYLARNACYLYDKGVRENMHVLGLSGALVVPVIVYLSRFIENLTFDSATPTTMGQKFRRYDLGFSMLKDNLFLGTRERKGDRNVKLKELPCTCPVCEHVTVEQMYGTVEQDRSGLLLDLHNMKLFTDYLKMYNSLIVDPEYYKEFVRKNQPKIVNDAIDFIDRTVERGWKNAWHAHKGKLTYEAPQKQQTLGGWQ